MKPGWITDSLPDSDMTVLIRVKDREYPVYPGFHDGECWRRVACESIIQEPVIGWMELETAAKLLDEPGIQQEAAAAAERKYFTAVQSPAIANQNSKFKN